MYAVVFEHVPVAELPEKWRAKLAKGDDALVTVRIEEEAQQAAPTEEFTTDDPAFGIWRDHDVPAYVRRSANRVTTASSPPMQVDTDALIWHLRGTRRPRNGSTNSARSRNGHSYLEVLQGMRNKTDLLAVKKMLDKRSAMLLPVTEAITQRATELMESLT